jgi:hypothetical protein
VSGPTHDVAIDDLLDQLGFGGERARGQARGVLEAAGLTNPRKQRIASTKVAAVQEALTARFVRTCARTACREAASRDGREIVEVGQPRDCESCGGRENSTEIDRAITALRERELDRVVVVGGSPATHEELRRLVADRLELRLIPGTDRRNGAAARADLAWADLVVVWGGTELDHKVSKLYTDGKPAHVVTCPRRGIAALGTTLIEAARRRT